MNISSMRAAGRRVCLPFVATLGLAGHVTAQEPPRLTLAPVSAVQPPDKTVVVDQAPVTVAPAITPTNLETCLAIAAAQQPALSAARASLAAAQSGQAGLNSLGLGARLLARDLPIRKEQACIGVGIAAAGLSQAEWETRYAVARTYYSVIFARMQRDVVDSVITKLSTSREKAERIVAAGDPALKVTQIDVDTLGVYVEFARAKRAEADVGVAKAMAGLREAMGVGLDYPLDVPNEPLPALVPSFDKQSLIASALANRGEMAQAAGANQVAALEIDAQRRQLFKSKTITFAAGSDIHARPIPQGVANGEYRPGAIGLEMPVFFAGKRPYRVERAEDLSARAGAVLDKTTNLIALEVEASYLKWQEAADKVRALQGTIKSAAKIADTVQGRFDAGNVSGDELLRARTLEDQARAQLNEALFNHAVALATLERVTAGGYRLLTCPVAAAPAPAALPEKVIQP